MTGEWRKGQEQSEFDLPTRPRSRETKIDSPVHDHKTPPPKIHFHQHQKHFPNIRFTEFEESKIETMKKTGL